MLAVACLASAWSASGSRAVLVGPRSQSQQPSQEGVAVLPIVGSEVDHPTMSARYLAMQAAAALSRRSVTQFRGPICDGIRSFGIRRNRHKTMARALLMPLKRNFISIRSIMRSSLYSFRWAMQSPQTTVSRRT